MADDGDLAGATEGLVLEEETAEAAEISRLRAENEDLRRRVAALEAAAAATTVVPPPDRRGSEPGRGTLGGSGGSGGSGALGGLGGGSIEIAYDELDVREQIGGGGFSTVHRALWKGTPVAVKKWFDPNMSDALKQAFLAEVMTLRDLRHPHVVQLLGACTRPPQLCVVMEHVQQSLHTVLHESPQIDVDRRRGIAIAADAARSLAFLHSRRPAVIHRDVKPANFLVDRSWRLKLCDFGLASAGRDAAGMGTPAYMAPELLAGRPYTEKVDVFAFAVLAWEILCREIPWQGDAPHDIGARVLAGERLPIPLAWPRQLGALVAECWADDAAARPSFDKICESLKSLAG